MYLCESCHEKQQERPNPSRHIAWTGESHVHTISCGKCSKPQWKKVSYEYLTAFELAQELKEAKTDLKELAQELEEAKTDLKELQAKQSDIPFPIEGFYSATELLRHVQTIGSCGEMAYQLLEYAAELEGE
jgi:hypothetical protein